MARWSKCWRSALRPLAAVALAGTLGLAGCGKEPAKPDNAQNSGGPETPGVAAVTPPRDGEATRPEDLGPPPNDEQHLPFTKATRRAEDGAPPEMQPPPDKTMAEKSVGKLYTEVVRLWDTIRFVNPRGQHLDYSATIETDLGSIEIALRPDLAPNHVRSFVALARAGYYDGLCFDRIRSEKAEGEADKVVQCVEAGCPLGTGEPGFGSIGYWLNPEFPRPEAKASHEEGTVGACHGNEADTAACRFYITLCPAPALDGNYTVFGKVTRGLDVAKQIFTQPHIEDDQDADGSHRPKTPVVIRKVTIHSHPQGVPERVAGGIQ
jgi:cyclophilin family peptidyl-prolyl cis-trans isomerase